jgi:hypothetical protein
MKITCPECRVPVAAEDVNLATGLAKCRTCNNVFRFADDPELAPQTTRARAPVEKPRSIVTYASDGELTLDYRWFSPKYIFMVFFCLFWNGFLVFWYTAAFQTRNPIMMLFPLLHVGVGLFITYITIAGFVNTTTVQIDRGRIQVRHHPLPFGRRLELATGDVKQLFCQERISRSRNGVAYMYDLVALLRDGTRRKVVSNLDSPELTLYLEQNAEAWLRIPDEAVTGELVR